MTPRQPRILVVDDEEITRENIVYMLGKGGRYQVSAAPDGESAIAFLKKNEMDLILTDLRMKGKDGLAVLAEAKELWPESEVVVITGYATVDTAVEAMQKGAYHYLAKPIKFDELLALVAKALEKGELRREVGRLRQQVSAEAGAHKIIGRSPKTSVLRETVSQVAQLDCNVLIHGETGTGKELVARVVHELSPRAGKRFVAFNCGAFTEELIASELFGHERGAFTGASHLKKGLLEQADGGTVFFDEVGELSLAMQVTLLRFLQERTFLRVGGTDEVPVDVRILAATNKDLKQEAESGAFRHDLYYRLDVLTIKVPSLAERKEDIPMLVNYFMAKHAPSPGAVPTLSEEVIQHLMAYDYPGNIRELENIAQRLLLHHQGGQVDASVLARDLQLDVISTRGGGSPWPTLEEHEQQYILEVLDEVAGNRSQAAKILGIDRVSLWRKLKRYGLETSSG